MLHRTITGSPRETSPYLLQHRHNPVDWWPWGPEALAEAQRSNRPILLSVGYAACHWCHVMAHESFEDDATAAVMNELFVSIKVDREERPDIDQIYMSALHHLGQQGGWPLTMFLAPDGSPFWGGTYFPKTSQYGRPAFTDVLREVARIFREEPGKIAQNRDALVAKLAERARAENPANLGVSELDDVAASIARATDPVNGGLRGAPKFPQCAMLEFLWRAGARTTDPRFFATSALALTRMSQGGIYDHLGGGYARYSVDERWLVPHFEKMLYDNAQILDLLALDYARSPNPLYRAAGDRDGRVADAGNGHGGRRLCVIAGRRFGRRGGQVLRLVARTDPARPRPCRCRTLCCRRLRSIFCREIRHFRRWKLRRSQYPQPSQ